MKLSLARFRRFAFLFLFVFAFVVVSPASSAYAMTNRSIVLRATGSGTLIGLGAGLISYPFAKSTGTIIAGAVVGAILGTIYGFYLVDRRDQMYRTVQLGAPFPESLTALSESNEARNAILHRDKLARPEFSLPFARYEF